METPKVEAACQVNPERPKRGNLPIELWLTIVQSLRLDVDLDFFPYLIRLFDMRALKNLRLVSRTLNDVTEPLYWERVELSAPREAMETVRYLKANPVRSNYVKYMVLKGWRTNDVVPRCGPGGDGEPSAEALSELLPSMCNLRAILFYGMHLTPEIFAHLHTLSHLQCVKLWFSSPPIIPPSVSPDCGTLPVSTFTLIENGGDPLRIRRCLDLFVNPARIEQIHVSYVAAIFLYDWAESVTFDKLRRFDAPELALSHFHLFNAFTKTCPNLECLRLDPLETDEVSLQSIPSPPDDVLRHLRSFHGTLPLAARIVPTRPVEKVYADCRSEGALTHTFGPALQRLSTSSKTIRVLHLNLRELKDDHLSLVASNLPLLEELNIGLTGHTSTSDRKNETTLHAHQLQPLSQLQSFTLNNSSWYYRGRRGVPELWPTMVDGPSQVGLVKVLIKNHPLLEYVELGQTVRWHRHRDGWTWSSSSECGSL